MKNPIPEEVKAEDPLREFVQVIAKLRDPSRGCPWDLAQTHKSIRPYLIEEAYEVLESIDSDDDEELKKELGDVLLQVVLHSQIAKDRGAFTIDDVAESASEKMVRRHPHVFDKIRARSPEEVLRNWEDIKKTEKKQEGNFFSSLPPSMPALLRAMRMGEKSANAGFDWNKAEDVTEKIQEEFLELEEAVKDNSKESVEEELGDLLFTLAQYARKLSISPEDALRKATNKFSRRFLVMYKKTNKDLKSHSLEELEEIWEKSKRVTQD